MAAKRGNKFNFHHSRIPRGHPAGSCEVTGCKIICPHRTGDAHLTCPARAKALGTQPVGVKIYYGRQ